MDTGSVQVLIQLSEIRGQLGTFINLMGRVEDNYSKLDSKVDVLDNRLTAIEATRRATPSWWVWLPAVLTVLTAVFIIFDRLQRSS